MNKCCIWVSETVEMKDDRDDVHSELWARTIVNRSVVTASQMQHLFMPDSLRE